LTPSGLSKLIEIEPKAGIALTNALLGKLLTHRHEEERFTGRVIETEAYLGLSDPASHTKCRMQ
jgi:3-methyladenine DNA glycosylase Mpg